MMTSGSELSLEFKPHSYSILLKTIGHEQANNDAHDQTRKLEEFLSRLEEERLKIDAFKRELPLCMQLLTNGMYHLLYIIILIHAYIHVSIYDLVNFTRYLNEMDKTNEMFYVLSFILFFSI